MINQRQVVITLKSIVRFTLNSHRPPTPLFLHIPTFVSLRLPRLFPFSLYHLSFQYLFSANILFFYHFAIYFPPHLAPFPFYISIFCPTSYQLDIAQTVNKDQKIASLSPYTPLPYCPQAMRLFLPTFHFLPYITCSPYAPFFKLYLFSLHVPPFHPYTLLLLP